MQIADLKPASHFHQQSSFSLMQIIDGRSCGTVTIGDNEKNARGMLKRREDSETY